MCLSAALITASSVSAQQTQPAPASPQALASAQAPLPPATTIQPAPPPAVQKLPVLNGANDAMPRWLRVRGEFRERMEGFDGGNFVEARQDLYYLSRVRFNAALTPTRWLTGQVQVQDARVARKTVGPTAAPFTAPFDFRMAFADVGGAQSRIAVRVGRQELVFGEQRLVGHVSWLNAARSFDGGKVTFRSPAIQIEAFGMSVVRILDGELDKSGFGNRFAGAYVTAPKLIPLASVEPYVFWRRDVNLRTETLTPGNLSQTTAGVRIAGRLRAELDYGVEMALQRGSLGTDAVEAWAGHWQVRESLPGPGSVRVIGEYNYASGDADPTDGVRGTFDQLYPTGHDKYGLADQIGWKNIHHVRTGVELTPVKVLPLTVNYHSWWIAERRDGIYNAGSTPLARNVDGAANRHVGQELDIQVSRALTPHLQFAAGYAHIFTGPFLKETTPGASYSHPYVMATYVFLADR